MWRISPVFSTKCISKQKHVAGHPTLWSLSYMSSFPSSSWRAGPTSSLSASQSIAQSLMASRLSKKSLLKHFWGRETGVMDTEWLRQDLDSQGSLSKWNKNTGKQTLRSLSWVVIFSIPWPYNMTTTALAYVRIIGLDGQKVTKYGSISIKEYFLFHGVFESLERNRNNSRIIASRLLQLNVISTT